MTDTAKYTTGIYSVVFDRVIEDRAFIATIGVADPGTIRVTSDRPDGVYIDTTDLAGSNADRPFHLWVIC